MSTISSNPFIKITPTARLGIGKFNSKIQKYANSRIKLVKKNIE